MNELPDGGEELSNLFSIADLVRLIVLSCVIVLLIAQYVRRKKGK